MPRTAEARKVLAEFDAELAAASAQRGQKLVWTPSERAILALIGEQIDRKVGLRRLYAKAEGMKTKAKLATELRLLESSISRLVQLVSPDVPVGSSLRSAKARRAARVRWDGVRGGAG